MMTVGTPAARICSMASGGPMEWSTMTSVGLRFSTASTLMSCPPTVTTGTSASESSVELTVRPTMFGPSPSPRSVFVYVP